MSCRHYVMYDDFWLCWQARIYRLLFHTSFAMVLPNFIAFNFCIFREKWARASTRDSSSPPWGYFFTQPIRQLNGGHLRASLSKCNQTPSRWISLLRLYLAFLWQWSPSLKSEVRDSKCDIIFHWWCVMGIRSNLRLPGKWPDDTPDLISD